MSLHLPKISHAFLVGLVAPVGAYVVNQLSAAIGIGSLNLRATAFGVVMVVLTYVIGSWVRKLTTPAPPVPTT